MNSYFAGCIISFIIVLMILIQEDGYEFLLVDILLSLLLAQFSWFGVPIYFFIKYSGIIIK